MIRVLAGGVTVLAIAALADVGNAATTSPGKTAVYASTAAAVISSPPTVLTATISKGLKKRVLEVDVSAVLTGGPVGAKLLTLIPTVNGLGILEPINVGSTVPAMEICGNAPDGCSLSLQYWLDLDTAEADHPGLFVKQPLVIEVQAELQGFGGSPASDSGVVSLRARLQKK